MSGWNPKDKGRLCETISGAVAYDQPQTGQVYLLIFHQCIYVEHLDHHLLCPMQCRMSGVGIDETPKFLQRNPTELSHAIVLDEPEEDKQLIIPLSIMGVSSFFTCRKPTRPEYDNDDIPRIHVTVKAPDWDLSDREFAQREEVISDFRGAVVDRKTTEGGPRMVIDQVSQMAVDSFHEPLDILLHDRVNVSCVFHAAATTGMETKHRIMRVGVSNSKRLKAINHEEVQERWGIHPSVAKNTI